MCGEQTRLRVAPTHNLGPYQRMVVCLPDHGMKTEKRFPKKLFLATQSY